MATKKKTDTKVTRITATDEKTPKKAVVKSTAIKKTGDIATSKSKKTNAFLRPFVLMGGYFKGSWVELKQVHWPTRSATWGLTGAVIAFTGFFILLILVLDAIFKYLFEVILG